MTVEDADRTAYHAAAAIAANHMVALIGQVERVAATAGLPLDAFAGLMRAATDDALDLGPRRALTGPAARGDWDTVERHRGALAGMAGPPQRTGRLRRHGRPGPAALARAGDRPVGGTTGRTCGPSARPRWPGAGRGRGRGAVAEEQVA